MKEKPVKKWVHENKTRFIREGDYKYLQIPYFRIEELFNLADDPYEQNNLLRQLTPDIERKANQMSKRLLEWVDSARPLPSSFVKEKRQEAIEGLRALGYIE